MTRSDIFKIVHGMRSKKHKEKTAWYDCSENLDVSQSQEPSSNEDLGSQSTSGVNVCIFPCNNPIEHVIAECYRHAKHSREGSAAEASQSSGSDELSSSACESLLNQVAKKIEELQAEMKLYQAQNEQLKNMQQQYHQMLSKLQKDKEEFESHKEKETKKLQSEIEEEKRKMRIQKRRTQTLATAAKVEAKPPAPVAKDKNQNKDKDGQLQRKVALLTSENGRLKGKLQLAEQEKESLKALVKELEEQRIGLLEKLEKASELKCYPSLNELSLSPTSHLIMPMLVAPPGSPFQAEGVQQALESAHGDSLCIDTKNCKEASFGLSSKVHPRDVFATTGQASEPSVVISATVVTRLSLDSCLSGRSPIASPLGLCKREICNAVSWNSVQQLEQNANVEERAVNRPALRQASSQIAKTVRFATDLHTSCSDTTGLDGLSRAVTDGWSEGSFPKETIHISEADMSQECLGQPANQADVCVSSYKEVTATQRVREVPAVREMFAQNDGRSDFTTKVTKVGLVTKEILTNTTFKKPLAEMINWNVAIPKLVPQPSSSSTTVQDPVSSIEPTKAPAELPSVRSVAPEASQSDLCIKKPSQASISSTAAFKNSKKSSNEDMCALSSSGSKHQVAKQVDSHDEPKQGQSIRTNIINVDSTAVYETSKKSSEDMIPLSSSSSKHQVARESDSREESEQNRRADASVVTSEQAGRKSGEILKQSQPVSTVLVAKEAGQPDWEPNEEFEQNRRAGSDTNVSTKGGDHSDWESYGDPTEQSQLGFDDDFTKETGPTERETAPQSKCKTAEGFVESGSQERSSESDGTRNSLREILMKLGSHFPVPASSSQAPPLQESAAGRPKKPGGLASLPHLPTETKVSSLIKKYSQVNASSQDSSAAVEMRRARKSHSVQIQSPSQERDCSPSKSSSRTWALDSNGQKMFLTVVSKEIDPFTQVIVYKFQNGDKKHIHPDGKVVYHYAKSETVHTVYPCGKKEIKFANGQVETHTKEGDVEVTYPDGTVRRIFSTGEEEQQTADGIVARRLRDGTETIDYPNGQREVRSELYRSRYYPNGTVKTVYTDGKQVTRFPNGRVRVKEADGTVCSA